MPRLNMNACKCMMRGACICTCLALVPLLECKRLNGRIAPSLGWTRNQRRSGMEGQLPDRSGVQFVAIWGVPGRSAPQALPVGAPVGACNTSSSVMNANMHVPDAEHAPTRHLNTLPADPSHRHMHVTHTGQACSTNYTETDSRLACICGICFGEIWRQTVSAEVIHPLPASHCACMPSLDPVAPYASYELLIYPLCQ